MAINFDIEQGKYGQKLIAKSMWSEEISYYIYSNNISELELNHAKGWKGEHLLFLSELKQLKSFTILDWNIDNITPINNLNSLQSLKFFTYCKSLVDFEGFPSLEECTFRWRAKAKSIFNHKSLKNLFIDGYQAKDTSKFVNMSKLEDISLTNSPIRSLHGLGQLHNLKKLGIYNFTKLESLSGIETLYNLEELWVDGCSKVSSIDEVANLVNLRKLSICNDKNIESLKPIENLKELEWVLFNESTNIVDGDLSYLLNLKKLSNLAFQERRHYTHNRSHFPNI